MYTVTIRLSHLLIAATFAYSSLFASHSLADTLNIQQLMESLAKAKPNHATFTEKKYIALLDEPVESSGELFFVAPDQLEKRTLLPQAETLLVNGNKILIERGNKTYYFTTQNLPELGVLINSIRGTLAGNQRALESSFHLKLTGNIDEWTLQLSPTNEKIQKLLKYIHIAGHQSQIQSIEVFQVDGDRSHMRIQPVKQTQ